MTRVDFYVMADDGSEDSLRLVCRLVHKAYRRGHRVYIQAASEPQAARLDDLLWTYTPGSFLPHGLAIHANPEDHPILIGYHEQAPGQADLLINLAPQVPPFFERFERIVELVEPSAAGREAARERYRFYRERGCTLETHALGQLP